MKRYRRLFVFTCLLALSPISLSQTEDQVNRMAKAVQFDDLAEVKKLIEAGISPNLLVRGYRHEPTNLG